jgi:hypothetical protein
VWLLAFRHLPWSWETALGVGTLIAVPWGAAYAVLTWRAARVTGGAGRMSAAVRALLEADPPPRHPTGFHPESLPAQVLDFMNQHHLGLRGLAAAADVVAADCRFNDWVLTDVKTRKLSDEQWLRFLEKGEANEARCRAAMAAFARDGDRDRLCAELAAVASFLNDRTLSNEAEARLID